MTCDKCGYAMDAWDKTCLRCGGKGLATPAGQPAATKGAAPARSTQPPAASRPTSAAQAVADVKVPRPADKYADVDRNIDLWWECIGGGILLWLGAGWSYIYFTSIETSGGIRLMRWWLALAYNLGGKWPIIVVMMLLGIACIGLGINEYLDLRRKKLI